MDPINIAMLCILIVLLLLSAFFSSAETALTTVNRMRVRMRVEEGKKNAVILTKVLEDGRKMLSTVLILNNIVNIAASSIATIFTQRLVDNIYVSIGVGIFTFILIIFGEIIPKTIASMHSESIALHYARPIRFLMILFTPLIFILNLISTIFLKIFRVKVNLTSKKITEGELRTIMDVTEEEGLLESEEVDIINNVFDFGDLKAKDIMIPKVDIVMVSIDTTYEEFLDIVKANKFTRMPVYKDSSDNIVGIVNIKDLIVNHISGEEFDISEMMRDPFYTIATKEINDLLFEMKEDESGMCIVLDEYGQVDGMITLEDILEEIVGDMRDEFDAAEEEGIQKVGEHRYKVDGSVNLDDFNEELGTDIDSDHYESVGGLIIEQLERIPKTGDVVKIDNCKFTVIDMDSNRVESVAVDVIPKKKETEENE